MKVNSVLNTDGTVLTAETYDSADAVGTGFANYLKDASGSYAEALDRIFTIASDTYNVPKTLLKAMAKAESNFRNDATSSAGAMGIMQLMPSTASSLGVTDAYDPEQNIMGGAKYISSLLEKYNGNLSYAIAAYNAGSGNVDKYGGIPPFTETQNYVAKVLQYYEEGVTIPGELTASSVTDAGSASQTSSGSLLQEIMDKYFDYEDYLAFLQLFTKVLSEKINGSGTEENEDSDGQLSQEILSAKAEPAKQLTMTVQDAYGNVRSYRQSDGQQDDSASDAYEAYQYMTSGGQSHVTVMLQTKTV